MATRRFTMFATKGRLKVLLLVVSLLVVGLGMYAAFQVQEVHAHVRFHSGADNDLFHYSKSGHKYKWKDMSSDTISGTCSYCGSSTTINRTRVREECWNVTNTYHRIVHSFCHRHWLNIKWARYYWRLDSVTCSNSSCGG